LTAGSTREGEEVHILDAWMKAMQDANFKMQNAKLVMAPRHPGRFSDVEGLLKERKVRYAKRSQQLDSGTTQEFDLLLLDTIGELISAYAAADMAFVGGSLVPVGGHNPLEPAALGLPVIFGPHMFNAKESADRLLTAGGALQIATADELSRTISDLVSDPQKRARIGSKAAQVVNDMRGATRRTADLIDPLLVR
jgi:3-deoxy-D-manno-octulosonic-acid transferase